jgi:hypothetical protein
MENPSEESVEYIEIYISDNGKFITYIFKQLLINFIKQIVLLN